MILFPAKLHIILQHYGILGLFVVSFVEAALFPISPSLVLIPLVLANPAFGLLYSLITVLGSVLGSILGYRLGSRAGYPILKRLINKHPNLAGIETGFSRYGGWLVVASAFIPLPYEVFTISAGVFRIPWMIFLSAAFTSRVIHFFSITLLTMFYGPKVRSFFKVSIGPTRLIILASLCIAIFLLSKSKLVQIHLYPRLKALWLHWLVGVERFSKRFRSAGYIGYFFVSGATLTIFGFLAFFRLSKELLEHELFKFDIAISQYIFSFRTAWLTEFMRFFTNVGSTVAVIGITLGVIGFWYWRRPRKSANIITLLICTSGGFFLTEILRFTYHRMRPSLPWLAKASGYSFPSSHAVETACLYWFLAYIILRWSNNSRWLKRILAILLLLISIWVGISRVYLGVHYPSDVLAGWAIAIGWVGTCITGREILGHMKNNLLE